MNRNTRIYLILVLALAALTACSSKPTAQAPKRPLDKIQGKAQVLVENNGATDAALNGGGNSSFYLWVGDRRYRLFLKSPADIVHGNQYVAEGVFAQKAIDEIGDPDQGKNGYPLEASCQKAVTMAWTNLAFDDIDATVSLVKARVKRYPARPLFLVTRIRPATADEIAAAKEPAKDEAAEAKIQEVSVAADKERALLVEGATVQPAPLWEPTGGTVRCKVVINPQGKIDELDTGAQLCESVQWSQFRFQPPVKAGHPVKVDTEVEVKFEPRK
jgi:hypothetical protein